MHYVHALRVHEKARVTYKLYCASEHLLKSEGLKDLRILNTLRISKCRSTEYCSQNAPP